MSWCLSATPPCAALWMNASSDASALALALAEVRGERDRLVAKLERVPERLREAHVLLAQERALPAPSVDQEPSSHRESLPRPWWSRWAWWRR
jgi:hypothetical protein